MHGWNTLGRVVCAVAYGGEGLGVLGGSESGQPHLKAKARLPSIPGASFPQSVVEEGHRARKTSLGCGHCATEPAWHPQLCTSHASQRGVPFHPPCHTRPPTGVALIADKQLLCLITSQRTRKLQEKLWHRERTHDQHHSLGSQQRRDRSHTSCVLERRV